MKPARYAASLSQIVWVSSLADLLRPYASAARFGAPGWGALVQVASRLFSYGVHATIMGVLAISYLLGDAIGRTPTLRCLLGKNGRTFLPCSPPRRRSGPGL